MCVGVCVMSVTVERNSLWVVHKEKMNGFGSECSSGCESGWTMYFDQFGDEQQQEEDYYKPNVAKVEESCEDEEDLSMISDASSGPPHYCSENGCFCSAQSLPTLMKKSSNRQKLEHKKSSMLDDTASSPLLIISKNNFTATMKEEASMDDNNNLTDFSQGFLQTHHFKGISPLQTTVPRNPTSAEPVTRERDGWIVREKRI